jgi:hypothetical protein
VLERFLCVAEHRPKKNTHLREVSCLYDLGSGAVDLLAQVGPQLLVANGLKVANEWQVLLGVDLPQVALLHVWQVLAEGHARRILPADDVRVEAAQLDRRVAVAFPGAEAVPLLGLRGRAPSVWCLRFVRHFTLNSRSFSMCVCVCVRCWYWCLVLVKFGF